MNFRAPANEFGKTSYRWEGSRAAVKTCVGNAAISIGWIPTYQKREQMPEGCLHDQWDLDESIALLLSYGEPFTAGEVLWTGRSCSIPEFQRVQGRDCY